MSETKESASIVYNHATGMWQISIMLSQSHLVGVPMTSLMELRSIECAIVDVMRSCTELG